MSESTYEIVKCKGKQNPHRPHNYRIFNKKAHIQNIGKQGLTKQELIQVLDERFPDNIPIADSCPSELRGETITRYSLALPNKEREHIKKKQCLIRNKENTDNFNVILMLEYLSHIDGMTWCSVCLFDKDKHKYIFRGFTPNNFEDVREFPKSINQDYYICLSNMETTPDFFFTLKQIIS